MDTGFLVLSRRKGEEITLTAPGGVPIVLTVLDSSRGVVRIGIRAPREVNVMRSELLKEDKQ